jgi:dihydrofolate synthase / folylpolyglutamate synthase
MDHREAERWVLGLELFGMRFGTERMHGLLDALGRPQDRFEAVHVVGTNGKSSTVRMVAALVREHGRRVGAYLSPHLVSLTERVRVGDADVAPEALARALTAVRDAGVPGVTQFEALTAAAFLALAEAEVEVAVVEAGLGGRYDATNVLERSPVQVLTNVGLEHTRWLGETIAAIASEKAAVVRPGATLVAGAGLHPDALAVARAACAAVGARLVVAPAEPPAEPAAPGAFQRANLALAAAAAQALLGPLDPAAVARAAATLVPGRFELVDRRPDTILDGAHNAEGMAAFAHALAAHAAGRRTAVALSVLDDKDAARMLRALAPAAGAVVATRCSHPRAVEAQALAAQARAAGGWQVAVEADPARALARARALAGPEGVAAAAGSLYLLADLRRPAGVPRSTL